MNKEVIVAPSLLAADFKNLDKEVRLLQQNGVKFLHFDVMDGHFVPNLSFGTPILEALKPHFDFIYDVHLMVNNPYKIAKMFIASGADIITFHFESFKSEKAIINTIKMIKKHNVKVGMSVKPLTPIKVLEPYLKYLDLALVMSVEPGFGGQKFLASALEKIAWLKFMKEKHNFSYLIEVDGGINDVTGKLAVEAGAEVLVAGSYLFGKDDISARIKGLRHG